MAHADFIPETRPLPGAPGYRVTADGRVQTCQVHGGERWIFSPEWRDLSPALDRAGRPTVTISVGGKTRTKRVCVLVLQAFAGPKPAGMGCRHKNGNPADNRIDNLAWGTHAENMADRREHGRYARGSKHHNARLTEAGVVEMRRLHREGWSYSRLMRRFGLARTTVAQIVKGQFWKHVPDALTPAT